MSVVFSFLKHHKKFDMARVCKFEHPILRIHYCQRGVEQNMENKITKVYGNKEKKKKTGIPNWNRRCTCDLSM